MHREQFILVSVGLFVLVAGYERTEVNKCPGNKPFPLEVQIVGCTTPPCKVYKGAFTEFYITFVNDFDTTNLTTLVKAHALGSVVPYELPAEVKDVCSNLMHGAYCPLYPEEDVTYRFLFYVSNIYPEIKVNVEIYLVNQDNDVVTCFQCPIKVHKAGSASSKMSEIS